MESILIERPGAVIDSLQERIDQLEAHLRAEREYQATATPGAVADVIRRLRLHGVILLQLGPTTGSMERELNENPALNAAYSEVWMLDAAPLDQDAKVAIREAANHGMVRW